jgi:uncharacterized protein YbjT (DUF2867 family)
MVRDADVARRRLGGGVEIVAGDVLDAPSLASALAGVDTAFYLIHSMASEGDFAEADRVAAHNFGRAAGECGVRRIVYLGGLGTREGEHLSSHLASRHEVGAVLRRFAPQVVEFQASIILGSGSLSFELIRALTERLPVMLTPRWVSIAAQPIAIEDAVAYLLAAIDANVDGNRVYEIGGRDVVSYGDLMKVYARQRGLRRVMIPVPVLTPWLSSLWLALFTPIYQRVGRRLVHSIKHPTVVRDASARHEFAVDPMGVEQAIERALAREDREMAETTWADALSSAGRRRDWGGVRFGNRLVDSRVRTVDAHPSTVFRTIVRIGGDAGWYYGDRLWRLRGALDVLAGGPGMRRGRRDAEALRRGDVLDCWRVEEVVADRRLRLAAEMKLPGRAWLEFEIAPEGEGAELCQTAVFDPVGLFGLVYWYALYPLHQLVFAGLIREIARRATASGSAPEVS